MENSSYHFPEGAMVRKHCNDQYHKVKSMTERVKSISESLQSHSDKVALLANGASKLINLELEQLKLCDTSCGPIDSRANEQDLSSMIHKKLGDIMTQSENACKNAKTKQILRKSNGGTCSRWSGEGPRDQPRDQQYIPSLPTTPSNPGDGMSSCTESDFIPVASCDGDTSFDDSTTSSFCKEMHDKHPELFSTHHRRRQLGAVGNNLASAAAADDDGRWNMTEEELNFLNESERNSFTDGCEKSRYFIENQIQPQVDFINSKKNMERKLDMERSFQPERPVFVFDKHLPTDIPSTSYSTARPQASNRLAKFRATKQLRPRDNLRDRRLMALHGRTAARCRSSYHLSTTRGSAEAKAAHALKKSKSFDSAPCPVKRLKSTQSEIFFI